MKRIKTEEKYIYCSILVAVVLIALKLTLLPVIPWWVATLTLWIPFAFMATVVICLLLFVIFSILRPKSKVQEDIPETEF